MICIVTVIKMTYGNECFYQGAASAFYSELYNELYSDTELISGCLMTV